MFCTESVWSCGWFLAVMFVFLNMTVQLSCSVLVMARKNVKEACYALFFIIALQTVGYSILWDMKFLARYSVIHYTYLILNMKT